MFDIIKEALEDIEFIDSEYLINTIYEIEEDFTFGMYEFINYILCKNYDPNDYPVFEESFLNKVYILIEEEAKNRKLI